MYFLIVILFTCLISALSSPANTIANINATSIKCKDPSGADIDWFIIYKLPKIKESLNPLIRDGVGFSYILPGNPDWILSNKGINETDSIVGLTIQALFHEDTKTDNAPSTSTAYIVYNDQPPIGSTIDTGGHTKGILITSTAGGLFLQHSVPHFPLLDKQNLRYSYPHTGIHNGQIFNCLSLDITEVDNIGNILEVTKPHVYNYSIPNDMANSLPTLEKILPRKNKDNLIEKKSENGPDVDYTIIQIQNAGRNIYSFAKGPSFHEEIYSDWIAPKFQTELDVQSWLNGPNPYPSNCTSANYKVFNIEDKEIAGSKFSTHNDHSKWAISTQQPLICIGDLNRMEHQSKRGGMVNCFNDKTVWKAFKKSVVNTQPCQKPTVISFYTFNNLIKINKANMKMLKYYL